MASSDYYLCDICKTKTFYDAQLDYDIDTRNHNPITHHPWPSGNVGYMLVLCKDCSEKHEVQITQKPPKQQGE